MAMVPIALRRIRRRRRSSKAYSRPWAKFRTSFRKTILYVVAVIGLHSIAMMLLEGMSATDALWLTLTTLTTVGYGDVSASSVQGRVATVLLLYVGGIFVAANLAGDFFDYRTLRSNAMKRGDWRWDDLQGHIVIVGSERDSEQHLCRMVAEFEHNEITADRATVLITQCWENGLPPLLENKDMRLVRGYGGDPRMLENAGVKKADIVIVLSWDENDIVSDGRTFDVIHRAREINRTATIMAECVDDANRPRLQVAGADFVMRPVRAYPEMLVGAMVHPGSGTILENLFTASGEQICCINGDVQGEWAEIVSSYVAKDKGIPIGYREKGPGRIVAAPIAKTQVDAEALFLIIRRDSGEQESA